MVVSGLLPNRLRVSTQVAGSKLVHGRLKMAIRQAHSLTPAEVYRCHAAECLRLAEAITDARSRATLRGMAVSWTRLAEHAEKNSRADPAYETPRRRNDRSGDGG